MFYNNKMNFIIKKPPPIVRQNGYNNLYTKKSIHIDYKKFYLVILLVICLNIYHLIYYIY
jgi:hypothetical protein